MGLFKKSELKTNYDLGKDLGSGNFAVVKEATNKKKDSSIPQRVAIKVIDKAKVEDMNDIQREIEVMNALDHPHIIKLFELYDEPKRMMLVMELVTGGELFDRIVAKGSYTEKDAAEVMKTLCQALSYMHSKNVVHRDLKPENILYASEAEDAPIKVADFGLARIVSGKEMMKTACGTPGYVAPEVLKNKGYSSGAVDMWSAGDIAAVTCPLSSVSSDDLCCPADVRRRHPLHFAVWFPAVLRRGAAGTLRADLAREVRFPVPVVGRDLPGCQEARLRPAHDRPEKAGHRRGSARDKVDPGQRAQHRTRHQGAQKVQRE